MQSLTSLRRRASTGRIPEKRLRAILTRQGLTQDATCAWLRGLRLARAV